MNRFLFNALILLIIAINFQPESAEAKFIGDDAPVCPTCCGLASDDFPSGSKPCTELVGGSLISTSLGTMGETYPVFSAPAANGAGLDFSLYYASYNADGEKASLNTVMGFGWSHLYNIFLFTQGRDIFKMSPGGFVTKYQRAGRTGPLTATRGAQQDIVENSDGSIEISNRAGGTVYHFEKIPANPIRIMGTIPWMLTKITDRNQNSTTLTYDARGLLVSVEDAFDRKIILDYENNRLVRIKDPLHSDANPRITYLSYDASNNLTGIKDPEENTVTYRYNARHQLISKIDKNGHRWTYQYNSSAKPVAILDESNQRVFSLTNDQNWATNSTDLTLNKQRTYITDSSTEEAITTRFDGNGKIWKHHNDKDGLIRKIIAPDGAMTAYTYDDINDPASGHFATLNVETETDANGHTTTYSYDINGNRTKMVDAKDNVTEYEYEVRPLPPFDLIKRIIYPNGSITDYQYDANGNRIQEIRDAGTGNLNLRTDWTYYDPAAPDPGNPSGLPGLMKTMEVHNGSVIQITRYEYDAFGNQTKVTDPEGNETLYEYDILGNRKKMIDCNNHVWQYEYDKLNRLKMEIDPLGFVTNYFYDGVGNRIEVERQVTKTPDTFQTTEYHYDLRNRLIKEIRDPDDLNLVTSYSYDNNDNRKTVTDPRGKTTTFDYDVQNRLIKVTDALTNITETRYDGVGNRICIIDANLHYSFFEYDALNRLIQESKKFGSQECNTGDADDIVTQHFYDSGNAIAEGDCKNPQCAGPTPGSSNIAHTIDPESKDTYYKYDNIDRRVMTIRKVGDNTDDFDRSGNPAEDDWSEIVQYDDAGNVLARIDANGNPTTFTYFKNNWLKTEANALNETTTYTYDCAGNIKTILSPGGNLTTNTYNDRNELIQVSDSEGPVAGSDPVTKPGYVYDGVGNRFRECDGNDHCSQNTYDAVNRLISVTDALGETSHYEYDAAGNLIKSLDREGHAMCYVPDDINRRIRSIQKVGDTDCNVIDGDDVWTKTVYDAVGNVTELTTAKKIDGGTPPTCNSLSPPEDCETARYVYDEVNRLVQEAYPLRQAGDTAKNTREFSYDKAGNLKQRIDQKNHVTNYVYNDLYYLTLRDYQIDADDRFAYDVGGRMLRAGRAGWIVTFDYDDANRVLQSTQDGKPVDYVYDIPNRRRTLTYPSNKVVTEDRDFRERLAEINGGGIAAYQYDPGNRVLTRTYGNGTSANYAYNDNNWITELTHTKAGPNLIAGFAHNTSDAYDKEGNKRFQQNLLQTDPKECDFNDPSYDRAKCSETYQYDDLYRLVDYRVGSLVGSTIPMPATQTQYDLDKLGNWDNKTTTDDAQPPVVQTREHNAVNEITQIDAVPLSYDDNGNLIQDERYSYEYDQENRLTRVSFIGVSGLETAGEYRYDALSRRIVKKTGLNRGNKETRYFYDDARIIEEQSLAGVTEANYVYGNYIDEVLTMDRALQTYYYHHNALWSVAAITDGAANVVERVAYDAYGHPTITDALGNVLTTSWGTAHSAIGNPWMFTGRQLDEESGLYFYRARVYDPDKGRFLQRDPLGYVAGMNLYEYVSSKVTFMVDPYGLDDKVPVKDDKGNTVGWIDKSMTNCIGYACRTGGSLTPIQEPEGKRTSLEQVFKALTYDCTPNISAIDCKAHCNCEDYMMLYVYIIKTYDFKKTKEKYHGKDPFKDPIITDTNELDYHGLRGEADGSYSYQGSMKKKSEEKIEKFIPTKGKPDYFGDKQLLGKYCCCKKKVK